MKKLALLFFIVFLGSSLFAGKIEKSFYFNKYTVNTIGTYQTVAFENTMLSGLTGEPMLPYHAISLMLPPGEIATGIEISGENEIQIPGIFDLFPQQYSQPISKSNDGVFVKNDKIYQYNGKYPASRTGSLTTHFMNGYAFALSTFTPVTYNPAAKSLSYFSKVTIRISTKPDPKSLTAMKMITTSPDALKRARIFAQNPEMINRYPGKTNSLTSYQYLIITPEQFATGFDSLLVFYGENGIQGQVTTTEYIYNNIPGNDDQQKIRNYIKQEVAVNNIEYVLLGGDVEHIPFRGFYCYANSGSGYEDNDIPADLYYSALDGEWNDSSMVGGNINRWGEPGEDDLLPEVSVARCPFSNSTELSHMVHKTLYYQKYPVLGELNQPYLVGEYLYDSPPTYGGDYMELLVDNHSDNGYYTHGIPSATNVITRLYDTPSYYWNPSELIAGINQGHSFIYHLGHANSTYMLELDISQVTNFNFSNVNGVNHNYTLLYTQGCDDGSFDYSDCIAEKAVTITNFLVAGIFNSRYGWFNQGTTDGPSEHLQREFVSALYNDTIADQIKEIGSAHMMSKIKTAPFIGLPGEFEPGAQRWVHYDCNVLGDPALVIWTDNPPPAGISEKTKGLALSVAPNPAKENLSVTFNLEKTSDIRITIYNILGQAVTGTIFLSSQNPGNHSSTISVSHLTEGIYYCRVESNSGCENRKIMVVK